MDFIHRSARLAPALEAYDASPARTVSRILNDATHVSPGDPAKMVAAMIASVDQHPAPQRIALGSDANHVMLHTCPRDLRLEAQLEDGVLNRSLRRSEFERLYRLRRDLLRLRRAAAPLVDVCNRLEHTDVLPIDPEMQPLFRDVSDHIKRAQEDIDSLREVLAFAFEASLMAGQSQQTEITRRLAAWAAILAVPTAVAGIYGMNFEHMPELKWEYGYYLVLGGILSVCTVLYLRFRHYGWL